MNTVIDLTTKRLGLTIADAVECIDSDDSDYELIDAPPRSDIPIKREPSPLHRILSPDILVPPTAPPAASSALCLPVNVKDGFNSSDSDLADNTHQNTYILGPPLLSSEFPSSEAALDHIMQHGLENGFAVTMWSSALAKGIFYWGCSRFGEYRCTRGSKFDKEGRKEGRKSASKKGGCPFKVKGYSMRHPKTIDCPRPAFIEPPVWTFEVTAPTHNHPGIKAASVAAHRSQSITPLICQYIITQIESRTTAPMIYANIKRDHPSCLISQREITDMGFLHRHKQRGGEFCESCSGGEASSRRGSVQAVDE